MGEEKIGWFWTNKEIFEMPSLSGEKYENDRFIFIVKKLTDESFIGTWALLNVEEKKVTKIYGWMLLPSNQ